MMFERFAAWRFMLKGTEKGTFSSMTLFAWLAIGIGVAAMSSLLSVMYGFEGALKERVLKAYPHIIIRSRTSEQRIGDFSRWTDKLKSVPGVERVAPFVESEMIVQAEHRTLGAVVWGLSSDELLRMKSAISQGVLPDPKARVPSVVLGSELAARLGVTVGDSVKVISPTETTGAMGLMPRAENFQVTGLYVSGHYDFDQQYLFLNLPDAQDLLKMGDTISGWHLWGDQLEESDEIVSRLTQILPPFVEAESWTVFNSALFQSLKLEQYAMFTILSFAIAIAVMNIVITLMMHVTHKRRNIGILRALGASKAQIKGIFVWQGALLGGVGLLIGAALTILFIVYVRFFSSYQLPEIYYDRSIPIEIRPWALLLIYAVAIVMIYLGTLYPAQKAAGLHPIDAIRE